MSALRLHLMGTLRVLWNDQDISDRFMARTLDVLICLALHPERRMDRHTLATLLWQDSDETQALSNLRTQLALLRRLLPPEANPLEVDRQEVRWRTDSPVTVDARLFLDTARTVSRAEEVAPAVALYGGALLPMRYDPWLEALQLDVETTFTNLLRHGIQLLETERDLDQALALARRLVLHDRLEESHHLHLIRLLMRLGDPNGALAACQACRQLLQNELDTPPSEALEALERELSTQKDAPHLTPFPQRPFVGRHHPLEVLLKCWRVATTRRLQGAFVRGQPGMGRTRLLQELFQSVRREGGTACLATCLKLHDSFPYDTAAQILRQLRSDRLSTPVRRELSRLCPELLEPSSGLRPPSPARLSWPLRHALNSAITAALLSQQPLLIVLDDIQWIDLESLDWLQSLLAGHPTAKLLVAAGLCSEPRLTDSKAAPLLRDLQSRPDFLSVELGPLSFEDTERLIAANRQQQPEPNASLLLHQETGGNPSLIVSALQGQDGQDGVSEAFSPLRSALELRLAELSPAAVVVLEVAALLQRPFHIRLMVSAAAYSIETTLGTLDELFQAQLICPGPDKTYSLAYPSLARVVKTRLSPARLRLLHLKLARALEPAPSDTKPSELLEQATHLSLGGEWESSLEVFLRAGTLALDQGALTLASDAIRQAQALAEQNDELTRGRLAASLLERVRALELEAQGKEHGEKRQEAQLEDPSDSSPHSRRER